MFKKLIRFYKIENNFHYKAFIMTAILLLCSFSIVGISIPIFISWVPTCIVFILVGIAINNYEKNS